MPQTEIQMGQTMLYSYCTQLFDKYTKKRRDNKEKGTMSKKEAKEWLNGSLHKYRCTWNPLIENNIATVAWENHIKKINEFSSFNKFYTSIMKDIQRMNQEQFHVGDKPDGTPKGAQATRGQRSIIAECIRFEIKNKRKAKNGKNKIQ